MADGGDREYHVTAAELVRNFAQSREMARRHPVHITHHGRETHVLCEAEHYRELLEESLRVAGADPLADIEGPIFSFADWIDDALVICDRELRIVYANRAAVALIGTDATSMRNRSLRHAHSGLADSLIEIHAARTYRLKEPSAADLPSPFCKENWLRFQCFPLADRVILKFRDITEDVRSHRKADVKRAILQAMDDHGGVGCLKTSVRGTISQVNEPFCRMVQLPGQRLIGMAVSDLVLPADRHLVHGLIEESLRADGKHVVDVRLRNQHGAPTAVRFSLVQLMGTYGAEGVVMLVTELTQTAALPALASA